MIKLDLGLIGRVLSWSNTVALSVGYRIGYREVNRLLLESITHRLLVRPLRCYGLAPGVIWRESLVCAFAMEILAERTRRSQDTAYTLGLLHAVGMIVIGHEMEAEKVSRPFLADCDGLCKPRERWGRMLL
jgi:HD-like signal output (HDOD) protein